MLKLAYDEVVIYFNITYSKLFSASFVNGVTGQCIPLGGKSVWSSFTRVGTKYVHL